MLKSNELHKHVSLKQTITQWQPTSELICFHYVSFQIVWYNSNFKDFLVSSQANIITTFLHPHYYLIVS